MCPPTCLGLALADSPTVLKALIFTPLPPIWQRGMGRLRLVTFTSPLAIIWLVSLSLLLQDSLYNVG